MKLYKIPLQKLTPAVTFQPRGSSSSSTGRMSYRYYPSWSTHTLVLFHGLVSSSLYLGPLASALAERKIAQVIVPDWRGHGDDTRDLKWLKPHEVIQDFEEILVHFKSRTAVQRISMLGHSFGARWLFKLLLEAPPSLKIDQGYLVAPFIKTEQLKPGWLEPKSESYHVRWPDNIQTGKERTEYPRSFLDYFDMNFEQMKKALVQSSFHLIEAEQDELLKPVRDLPFKSQETLPGATHMGIVMEPENIKRICDLIEKMTPT